MYIERNSHRISFAHIKRGIAKEGSHYALGFILRMRCSGIAFCDWTQKKKKKKNEAEFIPRVFPSESPSKNLASKSSNHDKFKRKQLNLIFIMAQLCFQWPTIFTKRHTSLSCKDPQRVRGDNEWELKSRVESLYPMTKFKSLSSLLHDSLQWILITLLILLHLTLQNSCRIWTECFDWPDLLTSPVVEAVECKVLEPKERILSKYSDFFIVQLLCQMYNIVHETLCTTVCMVKITTPLSS